MSWKLIARQVEQVIAIVSVHIGRIINAALPVTLKDIHAADAKIQERYYLTYPKIWGLIVPNVDAEEKMIAKDINIFRVQIVKLGQ